MSDEEFQYYYDPEEDTFVALERGTQDHQILDRYIPKTFLEVKEYHRQKRLDDLANLGRENLIDPDTGLPV